MPFMDETIAGVADIWDACANEAFLNQMAKDTLDMGKFYDYIVQDSLYLRGYLKAFAFAMAKAETLREMQMYYSLLGYVNDGENATRLAFLRERGLTDEAVDKLPMRRQCRAYVDFLLRTAEEGGQAEILMATLPCMLGYGYVFESLRRRAPQVMKGRFAPLVADYTSEGYRTCCAFWQSVANEKCGELDEAGKRSLRDIFRQASLHELYFWQMAGEDKI